MAIPLLSTKLYTSPVRAELVSRPRLIEPLNAGLHRKFALVSAPAGFGKATLLSEWAAGISQRIPWLSLDEHDNNVSVFVRYLIGAIRMVFPDACEGTLDLLSARQTPPLRVLATSLVNELDSLGAASSQPALAVHSDRSMTSGRALTGLVLALDDYQTIANPEIHDTLFCLESHWLAFLPFSL